MVKLQLPELPEISNADKVMRRVVPWPVMVVPGAGDWITVTVLSQLSLAVARFV